jgi:hypothetical protein
MTSPRNQPKKAPFHLHSLSPHSAQFHSQQGPPLSSLSGRNGTIDLCPALTALVSPVQKNIFLHKNSPLASNLRQSVVLRRLSLCVSGPSTKVENGCPIFSALFWSIKYTPRKCILENPLHKSRYPCYRIQWQQCVCLKVHKHEIFFLDFLLKPNTKPGFRNKKF